MAISSRIAFKLAAADVFEILPLGRGGGGLVQIDGNLVALPDFRAHVPRHGHAILKSDAVDGDEGNHVGRAQARVRALVTGEVDEFGGLADAANRRLLNRLALACQRDHAAVVVGIHLAIEQVDAGHPHGFDNGIDFGRVAALREVRYAFN